MNVQAQRDFIDRRQLVSALRALRRGDFSVRLPEEVDGVDGEIASLFNEVVSLNEEMTEEFERLSKVVGKEGKITQRGRVKNARGGWENAVRAVNELIEDMVQPTAEVSRVIGAVAKGDLSQNMTVEIDGRPLRGEFLRIGKVVNTMVDQLNGFANEVTRVAREVGTEGKLGGQARVKGVAGTWKDLTDNVNAMATNLTGQVRNIAEVTTAVARGDLSKKITVEVKGEILELKNTINTMVDQLNAFAGEVTRVAREVGTEGKLGGQARVEGVAGTWKDLTDNVNLMADNLTGQVRNIAEVTTAVAKGDLSKKITVDVKGEILELKNTINVMVDQLNGFASEVTRVAREVGTEGKLGGQAQVPGVAGTWKDLTDNVNLMAENLTSQVRNIAEVTTAVARGDLSKKITVDVRGEILELKDTINTMVDQLNSFASEVTRVAREVGSEGKLGGQAQVEGVAGTWADLTDNVNLMADNLTGQVRNIAEVTTAVARGDLSKKITVDVKGEILELKNTINVMVDQLNGFASEVTRVAREVGTEGKLGGQADVPGVAGTWKGLTDNVNVMAANLTGQVREIAEVATAIARGDLSRKVTVDVKGEILELKNTINTLVDQLNGFAAEVTRVAREVGTEGKLGGQAKVPGVAGIWKDLTDNVNVMAENLTNQVRGIVKVVTAVAHGDLAQKLTVESKGEVAALANTINSMTDTLAIFADQVTTVAREVGVEGRLGGQANVPGAAGTWKDLTANVNLLAANLTTQVRAIADVATAVTKGDLTRSIQVDARGEVADLKNYINAMIGNLRQTTERNTEQDWLKTNLANFSRVMQGQRDLHSVSHMLLSELAPLVAAQQGLIYVAAEADGDAVLQQIATYADSQSGSKPRMYSFNEGLIGQCARERKTMILKNLPENAVRITSGVVDAAPRNVVILPVLFEGHVKAVIELASVDAFTAMQIAFLEQLSDIIGVVFNNIEVTMRTERLLAQSQQLATEQQTQQQELQKTNEELAQKAQLLAAQNAEVERKNQEIEQARRALEEKAAELALTSRYKSEFLANMSHELRTPLNSILVLGQQLADNGDRNLNERQVEYAHTIRAAGTDLLNLISDILDLSKIESGTVTVESEDLPFASLKKMVERNFRHEAESRDLTFTTELDRSLGRSLQTDPKRLLQVLKNLLSNAFKFTEHGTVSLKVYGAQKGWTPGHPVLDRPEQPVVAFAVSDTGIGIPPDKQRIIFEAFQQADAGTARKHGGTGLGLAISRELAQLLGGEIRVKSEPGSGSTFTLYLPAAYAGPALPAGNEPETAQPRAFPSMLASAPRHTHLYDDREQVAAGDPLILIVHRDEAAAAMVLDAARASGLKGIATTRAEDAVALARRWQPELVSLDDSLADAHGWSVLSRFKRDPDLRHIPVQMFVAPGDRPAARARGACSGLARPVAASEVREDLRRQLRAAHERRPRRLLVVEGESVEPGRLAELLGGPNLETVVATGGADALRLLAQNSFDCVALDALQREMPALSLLGRVAAEPSLRDVPFVVYARRDWLDAHRQQVAELTRTIVLRTAPSLAILLDDCCMFLHRKVRDLPDSRRQLLLSPPDVDVLAGKTVLVVDDDVRNIFALSSLLERQRMTVISATTGRRAIEVANGTRNLSLIVLDVMMPEMDGYETMRRLRSGGFERPIVALTAKAMTGDREKCLEAGASDYIAKPVDSEHFLSLLKVWLDR